MKEFNIFNIDKTEKLFIDGIELKNVMKYRLEHSAGDSAELTITLCVNVNQADSELEK